MTTSHSNIHTRVCCFWRKGLSFLTNYVVCNQLYNTCTNNARLFNNSFSWQISSIFVTQGRLQSDSVLCLLDCDLG